MTLWYNNCWQSKNTYFLFPKYNNTFFFHFKISSNSRETKKKHNSNGNKAVSNNAVARRSCVSCEVCALHWRFLGEKNIVLFAARKSFVPWDTRMKWAVFILKIDKNDFLEWTWFAILILSDWNLNEKKELVSFSFLLLVR